MIEILNRTSLIFIVRNIYDKMLKYHVGFSLNVSILLNGIFFLYKFKLKFSIISYKAVCLPINLTFNS